MKSIPEFIESWFANHMDGEFHCGLENAPLQTHLPTLTPNFFIYTSKPHNLSLGFRCPPSDIPFATIGTYGTLPTKSQLSQIQQLTQGRPLLFLGDLDPPDLLIYLALQQHFGSSQIRHLGINDQLIAALAVEIHLRSHIQFSETEEALAFPVLENLAVDLPKLIGPKCTALLHAGYKLELEGLFNCHSISPTRFYKHTIEFAAFTSS